jgi:hypothetical protein
VTHSSDRPARANRFKRESRSCPQSRLFIKKAREIEADEKRSAADELLGHLHNKLARAARQKKTTNDKAARRPS